MAYNDNSVNENHGGVLNKPYIYKVKDIKANKLGLPDDSVKRWTEILTSKGHKDNELVCVFQPRVQVLDNWGWCTGSCPYKEGGCYNEYKVANNIDNHCEPDSLNAWIEYNDIVIVAP